MIDPERTLEAPAAYGSERGASIAGPQLLVLLECARPNALSSRHLLAGVEGVTLGRGTERRAERSNAGRSLDLRIPDRWMSSAHATIERDDGRWIVADAGSRNGTRVNGSSVQRHVLADGDLVELGHTLVRYRDAPSIPGPSDLDLLDADPDVPGIRTLDPSFAAVLAKLPKLAPSDVAMLLLGESGTGKELLARGISTLSGRRGDFVAVNCGGLPATLIESELFGYRKGAFSGADEDRRGLVRAADGGTLFLDEIADLPAPSQATLLRVLQEREVRPLGATRSITVDLRLISATHQDLDRRVEDGDFRRDLFARISAFRVVLPPLRERRDDLGLLVGALLERLDPGGSVTLDPDAARTLFRHDWPLNVRELENCLAAGIALAEDGVIHVEHLPETVRAPRPPAARDESGGARDLTPDQAAHREELVALFREHRGNVSAVARATGKARTQVQRWVKRYAIDPEAYR